MKLSLIYFLCLLNIPFSFATVESVDLNRFSHLLSNHFIYEHFDKAYSQLARRVSLKFRNSVQIKLKKESNTQNITSPVDVQILTRQLKGAVSSFIEDKLLAILTRHDTTHLQNQLDSLIYDHCSHSIYKNVLMSPSCLLEHQDIFLLKIHEYMNQHVHDILIGVNEYDMPRLFEKTRAQISEILIHFNQNTMNPFHHQLEWYHTYNKDTFWITSDMIQEFISIINHAEEEENNIRRLLHLSK
ncbi:unnamed protein product [Rhizopus stolonifer]